jgi:hypothetical protein
MKTEKPSLVFTAPGDEPTDAMDLSLRAQMEYRREYSKQYALDHKEKIRAKRRAYYQRYEKDRKEEKKARNAKRKPKAPISIPDNLVMQKDLCERLRIRDSILQEWRHGGVLSEPTRIGRHLYYTKEQIELIKAIMVRFFRNRSRSEIEGL